MKLADFILAHREPILAEWDAFARTCEPASGTMDVAALRDHAAEMLTVIAADLATAQSDRAQVRKSKGLASNHGTREATAAEIHGAGRAESGFTLEQIVAEYRSLRASVIRLWTAAVGELTRDDVDDLTRFNEAIDQSLAESVARYSTDLERAKETFIAILGHDLRTPLGAIQTSAAFMLERGELAEPDRTLTTRIVSSARRTMMMVRDLLDFTRSRLGGGIPVESAEASLDAILRDVVEEVSAAYPDRLIHVDIDGEHSGRWDAARVSQALGNLIGNAVQHGAEGAPVLVALRAEAAEVTIAVHNRGASIPAAELDGIFNPMKMRSSSVTRAAPRPTGSLGLGLYIAERIVSAHGGRIHAESTDGRGTTFTVYLPREAPQATS